MNLLAKYFKKKWASSLGVVGAVCVFIWFMGPKLKFPGFAPLRPAENRLGLIIVLLIGWALYAYFLRWRAQKNNEEMLDALADDAGVGEMQAAEAAALQSKMHEAVEILKSKDFSKTGGRKFIYELPWYMIIGPPGAGKTTLLTNSGLNFPLEESHGKFSVKGVGGTRNCDWWFTDQAVLLDTAGRYTTQDSDSEVDKSAWDTFLQLLKDNRKRRPVNGMIVALALHDIIKSSEDDLVQMAKTIRFRISEIHEKFGMRPPVYLVVTKCDLMAGFADYFTGFDEEQRNQVWGFTLPAGSKGDFTSQAVEELNLLKDTLYKQLTTKLENEASQSRRDQIYGFPMQFAAIQKKLAVFTEQFSSESRLQEDVLLRGLYFTSATQDGSALDQVISSVSRRFGFAANTAQQNTGTGKSFFINHLLTDVIFGEAGLAGTDLAGEKRASRLQKAAAAVIGLVTLGIVGMWGLSHQKNIGMMEGVEANSGKLKNSIAELPTDSLDLLQTSAMLSDARSLDTTRTDEGFLLKRTGLYQGKTIGTRADRKYDELLIDGLLARLMVRLEHQMHAESDNSEFLFEALKTYQMLDNTEEYKADDVIGWFRFDYDLNLPRNVPNAKKKELNEHTEELFRTKPRRLPRPLDRALIDQYQQVAANTPLEKRAYFRLKQQHADVVNTSLRLTDAAGNDLARALVLSGDKTFNTSIPKFFTVAEYQNRFLPSVPQVSETLTRDVWVLGPYSSTVSANDASELQRSVTNQYYAEYIQHWQELLDSMSLRKSSNLQELAQFLSLVTDTDSPLKNLLVAVDKQTTLSTESDEDPEAAEGDANERQSNLASLIGNKPTTDESQAAPIDPVTLHFDPLHQLLLNWETNGSKLDGVLQQMADLNLQLLPMATTPGAATDSTLVGELAVKIQNMSAKAERLPPAVAKLVSSLTNDVNDASSGGFCAQLNALWESEVYPFYERALISRYPLSRRATNEITLEDFGRFFGPDGILDQFVNEYLASNVQKTPRQWTWVGSGSSQCVSDNTLRQLALADEIKQSFFSARSPTPSFSFDLNPSTLFVDKDIFQLFLTIGNRKMEFFHGPLKGGSNFVWPGESGSTEATLRVEPIIAGSQSRISLNGPWAILRMLDSGTLKQKSSSVVSVDYSFGGRPVHMEFRSSSFNPLNSRALRQFSCPRSL